MKSEPRNIRLSADALKALKILESAPNFKSRAETISQAIIATANGTTSTPSIKFRLLDPAEFLGIQAEVSEISRLLQTLKKDIMKIRPQDKDAAGKIARVSVATQAEIDKLADLRLRLANLARTTEALSPEDAKLLRDLIRWTALRIEHENTKPEHKPTYALELKLLKSFIP